MDLRKIRETGTPTICTTPCHHDLVWQRFARAVDPSCHPSSTTCLQAPRQTFHSTQTCHGLIGVHHVRCSAVGVAFSLPGYQHLPLKVLGLLHDTSAGVANLDGQHMCVVMPSHMHMHDGVYSLAIYSPISHTSCSITSVIVSPMALI